MLDELCQPILATVTATQWIAIQTIVQREFNLLWVTRGSQKTVDSPLNAVCHGVFRTIRGEEPQLRLVTLDIESSTIKTLPQTVTTIGRALHDFHSPSLASSECEYVERPGLLHVSRIWPDEAVNRANSEDSSVGRPPVEMDLHTCESTARLVSEKLGTLDSLAFVKVGDWKPPVLWPDEVEVEIFASRSTSFGRSICDATQGYSVDVVMNSLTGELLRESWSLLAPGGIMVEIGKRDILDRNWLPMDPFSHNRSFRSLDLSTSPLDVIDR